MHKSPLFYPIAVLRAGMLHYGGSKGWYGGSTSQPGRCDRPALREAKGGVVRRRGSDLATNVEKTAAKEGSNPAVEAGKEAVVGDAWVKEVARETSSAPAQSPAAKVIDGTSKVAGCAITAPFPMASIGSITLLRQLETTIQVCPSSSPRGSSWYVVASQDSRLC
jgi:hypothetical protein